MIDLYTSATANGHKVSIALEELELPYKVIYVNIFELEQKRPEFLKLNPNGRIPVIVDHDNDRFTLFESNAILVYVAERAGKLLPVDADARALAMQWLFFQASGIGPMHGQAGVFSNYFPTRHPDVIDRFRNESRRLYAVLDTALEGRDYLAGEYSIADIACFTWSMLWEYAGIDISGLPNLKAWQDRVSMRPAVQRGLASVTHGDLNWDDVLAKAPLMVVQ